MFQFYIIYKDLKGTIGLLINEKKKKSSFSDSLYTPF